MRDRRSPFADRLEAGEVIVIDGGMGTEVERLGGSTLDGVWSGAMSMDHPELVLQAHLNYLDAGAELLITNTYASNRYLLERAGRPDDVEQVNRMSVEAAQRACQQRDMQLPIAGSVSTTELMQAVGTLEERRRDWFEQAQILADAGCDFIVLEMMRDPETTAAALDAVEATGLAVWVGLSCHVDDGVPMLYNRTATLAEGINALKGRNIEALTIMHTEVADIDPCLDVVDARWNGPVGVYAHHGTFVDYVWGPDPEFTPDIHTTWCRRWLDRGVQIIGGCCGIGPEHIADLAAAVEHTS